MPNWCNNTVNISGSAKDIKALKAWMGDFDFNKIIPRPEAIDDGGVGITAGNTVATRNPKSKIFHRTGCSYFDASKMTFNESFSKKQAGGHTVADAMLAGYKPCKHCCCKPRMKGQDWDKPLEEGAALVKEYGYDNWYDWNIANWGTKWNVCDAQVDWAETFVTAYFDTAWCPPEKIYDAIVAKFPNLTVNWHYSEPGCGFSGNFETGEEFDYADPCEYEDDEEFEDIET